MSDLSERDSITGFKSGMQFHLCLIATAGHGTVPETKTTNEDNTGNAMSKLRIGLIGAGAIGRAHAAVINDSAECRLVAVADPSDAGRDYAAGAGVPWFADHRAMLHAGGIDGVIIATPNDLHLSGALDVIAAGLPAIVEKPVATTVAEGLRIADAAEAAHVAVLVGHHRRHNPIIQAARTMVRNGALGRLITVAVLAGFAKPPSYFELAWRKTPGTGGPVLINLIHEIDLIRCLCGEIASVQAITSSVVRGNPVEDTAAVLLHMASGAVATIALSDGVASPWSWDLASGESPNYPVQPARVQTHFLSGTAGSLALPTLEFWGYDGSPDWFAPIARQDVAVQRGSPYVEQLRHFCAVIRGSESPLLTARDATASLRATLAVNTASATGRPVALVA
jgi:predicted dehydrogenase